MTRKELERRLHLAVSALADIPTVGPGGGVELIIHGSESAVDIVADLGESENCTGGNSAWHVARGRLLGVDLRAFGRERHDQDAIETEPPNMLAGGVLSDERRTA